jgi:dTDP-4-amino-4,6-dideoxygalactose transaminase
MTMLAAPDVVDFAPPDLGESEIAEVVATLRSGWLSTGPRVARFERDFAAYTGAAHAVAVNSCTAALHLSLLASGVGPGDDVVTTPLTFCATANVIVHSGATPIFADVDPRTHNLTPAAAVAASTERTRAWLPVHFAGRPIDTSGFRQAAASRQVVVIEDAAHCVEGRSGGQPIGTTADFTCFSFYATKNLTTGEGGMVTTASADVADRLRVLSLHGLATGAWARYGPDSRARYAVVAAGFKYNMSDLQAAIGLHQLASLERRHARRASIWSRYDAAFAGLPIERPAPVEGGDRHARHLYTVLIDPTVSGHSRDDVRARLREAGVMTSIHFPALHLEPYYRERFGYRPGMCPVAESVSARTLSLPLSSGLTDAAVHAVIEGVRRIWA